MDRAPRLGVLIQAMLDQISFGVCYNSLFIVVLGLIEGKSFEDSWNTMTAAIGPCTRSSIGFWVPAITGSLSVPPALQLPFLNMCGFVWTIHLSLSSKKTEAANPDTAGTITDRTTTPPVKTRGKEEGKEEGEEAAEAIATQQEDPVNVSMDTATAAPTEASFVMVSSVWSQNRCGVWRGVPTASRECPLDPTGPTDAHWSIASPSTPFLFLPLLPAQRVQRVTTKAMLALCATHYALLVIRRRAVHAIHSRANNRDVGCLLSACTLLSSRPLLPACTTRCLGIL